MRIALHRATYVVVFALISGFFALSGTAAYANEDEVDRAGVREFLSVTGFDVALASISLSARDGPVMLGMEASDFIGQWTQVADDIFSKDRLQDMAVDMLAPTLTEDLRNEAMGFYGSDLGQRFVAAENLAHMMEDDALQDSEGTRLLSEAGEVRVALLTRMADGVDGSDIAVHAVQDIQIRYLMAASHAGLFERELDEGQLRAQMAVSLDELRVSIRQSGRVSAAYTYRDFSDDELTTYVEALETPTMQRVYELLNAVQFEIMANRFEKLAYGLANLRQGQAL